MCILRSQWVWCILICAEVGSPLIKDTLYSRIIESLKIRMPAPSSVNDSWKCRKDDRDGAIVTSTTSTIATTNSFTTAWSVKVEVTNLLLRIPPKARRSPTSCLSTATGRNQAHGSQNKCQKCKHFAFWCSAIDSNCLFVVHSKTGMAILGKNSKKHNIGDSYAAADAADAGVFEAEFFEFPESARALRNGARSLRRGLWTFSNAPEHFFLRSLSLLFCSYFGACLKFNSHSCRCS